MSELPKGWVKSELFDVVNVITGKKDANYGTTDGKYHFFTCAYTPLKSPNYSFEGKVLILPGNGANVGEVFYYEGKFEAYQRTYIIKDVLINPKFLYYHFRNYWRGRVQNEQFGTATNYIKIGNFKSYDLTFPPLNEQKRIVEKLDRLFANLDSLKTRLDHIPQLLKQFRQSVLTQAVTGKLTEEWRGTEYKNWKRISAQDICTKVQSGSTPKGKPFLPEGDVPYLKVYNIVNQKIDFFYKPQFIDEDVHENKLKRSQVYPGDVLMNIVGPPLGKIALVPGDFPEWNINQAITLFRPKSELNSKFLYYYFCEGSVIQEIIRETRGMVGQSNISLTQCRNFEIPVPNLEEQNEIVRRVEALFAIADNIEARYEKLKVQITHLPQAILAKAFRGELVPQDPNDEPAEELLERIQAEREGKTAKRKSGKQVEIGF